MQAEQNRISGALRTSAVQKRSGATANGLSMKITCEMMNRHQVH